MRWLIAGTECRKSRLHTLRGQCILPGGTRDLTESLIRRALKRTEGPWMTLGAVRYLDRILTPTSTVLELGSGSSTAWYAMRCAAIMSLEDDPDWAQLTAARLRASQVDNCDLHLIALKDFESLLQRCAPASFDLVIVDCNETVQLSRLTLLEAASALVSPGGHLLLDDSDRPAYRQADTLLADWAPLRFVGMKPTPLCASETTIYRRPARMS